MRAVRGASIVRSVTDAVGFAASAAIGSVDRTRGQYHHMAWTYGDVVDDGPMPQLPRPGRRVGVALTATEVRMGRVAIQSWGDAPEIHPSQIRVGDIIGTMRPTHVRYAVKLISGPQTSPRRWTFFGRDAEGMQQTGTFGEDDLVRRYAKAS